MKLKGRKCGMTQRFDESGNVIPCTVIQVEPNVIAQVKSADRHGYNAIQLASLPIKVRDERTLPKRLSKPLIGHYVKAGVHPCRSLHEVRVDSTDQFNVGQQFDVSAFQEIGYVDVTGRTKGKGYQGVMKKYGFAGGPASHGSGFHRHAGSTGNRSTPGRSFPGSPRASHMGFIQQTTQNLKIIAIDAERQIIVVRGAVPGPINGEIMIAPARKKARR